MIQTQYYSYDDYKKDFCKLEKYLSNIKNPHLVAIYRGSLILGTNLAYTTKSPLSIIKYQSYDANDKKVKFGVKSKIKKNQTIVILDDILDSGKTLKKSYKFFKKKYPKNKIVSFTLFGKKNYKNNISLNTTDKWVEFWYESSRI